MESNRHLNKDSLATQVYRMMKSDLLSMKYTQGSRIVIDDIENELNISRIPIRDALQKLSDEGLIVKKPRVGFFVAEFTREDIEDLFKVRTLIENFCLSSGFKKINKELMLNLEEQYQEFVNKEIITSEDEEVLFELENKFHQDLIVANGDSALINKFYDEIKFKIKMVSHISIRMHKDILEHLAIIKAIKAEDQQKAIKLLNHHLTVVEEIIINELNKEI